MTTTTLIVRSARPTPALALLAALALAGCDPLQASPGADFGVRLVDATPLRANGRITVPLRFAVDGCAAFDAAMRGPDRSRHPLAVGGPVGGAFTADLPVAWLRDDTLACADDALAPRAGTVQLEVTCRDAGRTVVVPVATSHATAARAAKLWEYVPMAVRYVFPGVDPLRPYALAPSLLDATAYFGPAEPTPDRSAIVAAPCGGLWRDPALRPRPHLAIQGRSLFLSGTPVFFLPACPRIEVAPGVMAPCAALLDGDPTLPPAGGGLPLSAHVTLPGEVFDVAFLPDGRLLVLSQVVDDSLISPAPAATVLSLVVPATGGHTTQILSTHLGERLQSGLVRRPGGGFEWLSLVVPDAPGPARSVLHVTYGDLPFDVLDPTGTLDLGGRTDVGVSTKAVWLSPDGASLVVHGHLEDPWLGPEHGPFLQLRADAVPGGSGDDVGAAWPDGAVALWSGAGLTRGSGLDFDYGSVQVFEAAPPHARRYELLVGSLPGAHRPTQLLGVVAVGDRLVLTTSSGLRVLGPDGALIGGADPLPCGLSPTSVAAQVGPTTVAVGAGAHVFTFDLSAP